MLPEVILDIIHSFHDCTDFLDVVRRWVGTYVAMDGNHNLEWWYEIVGVDYDRAYVHLEQAPIVTPFEYPTTMTVGWEDFQPLKVVDPHVHYDEFFLLFVQERDVDYAARTYFDGTDPHGVGLRLFERPSVL